MRQAFAVAAIADEQLQQRIQRGVVLLAGQLLDRQLIHRFIVLRVFRQARFQVCGIRQILGLAKELDLRLGAGQCCFVLVAFHCVEHGLRFAQFAPFRQATGVEDQGGSVGVVFAQQHFERGFGIGETAVVEQGLGVFEWIGRCGWRHLHMRLKHRPHGGLRLRTGKTVHWLTVLEQHHGRQAANAEAGDDVLFEIAVDLGQQQFALVALGNGLQQRHQRFARRTPFGPEIHQHRFVERVLDHRLVEIGGRGVEDVRRFLTHGGSRKSVNGATIRLGRVSLKVWAV